MARYINYFLYFVAGSLLIGFWSIVLIVALPRPWYQFRSHAYHEVMMNVAKQVGFSADDAILEGGGWYDCSIVFPNCTCYQFVVFPTEQNLTEFQQAIEVSGLTPLSNARNFSSDELFHYLEKSSKVVLKVNSVKATWDYIKPFDKQLSNFYWSHDDLRQRRHFIQFFGIGDINKPLELLDKPFSGNLVAINTEMGSYPPWACESEAQVIKEQ